MGLLDNVFGIHHLAFVVDGGCARDEHMAAIGIVDVGATLEGYPIVAGAIEMGGSIEIMDLLLLDAGDGIVVHLGEHIGIHLSSANASRGNKMGVYSEALCEEELITCTNHTTIIQVDIVDEQPGADTVGFERTVFFKQLHVVFVEEQTCLIL